MAHRRHKLRRLFSTFPGGAPGAGLLLLRAAVGVISTFQGYEHLADWDNSTLWTCIAGVLGMVVGVALVLGYLTPVVGALAGVGAIGTAFSRFPGASRHSLEAALPTALVVVIAVAVIFLGPGALSIDARLFGRREIIIPHPSRSAKP